MLEHLLNDLLLWDCGLIHAVQSIVQSLASALEGGYIPRQVCQCFPISILGGSNELPNAGARDNGQRKSSN
jgi:hypothetical protein